MQADRALDLSSSNSKETKLWTLIQAGSRFLSDAESRYGIIELESKIFLAGMPHFTVLTDHHPLIHVLNNDCLDEIENPRLQRLKKKIMGYNFTAEWIKGDLNNASDTLSRNSVSKSYPQELLAGEAQHHQQRYKH